MHTCTEFHAGRCVDCERSRRFAAEPAQRAPLEVTIIEPLHYRSSGPTFNDRAAFRRLVNKASTMKLITAT